jgi:hypothetical protein
MILDRQVYTRISHRGERPQQLSADPRKDLTPSYCGRDDVFSATPQRRRFRLPAVAALLSLSIIPLFAPAQQTQTFSTTLQYEFKPKTPYPTDRLQSAFPTVGLFIGVSDYGKAAKVTSTPAHSLGAAVMYEAFLGAATSAENESLGLPAYNYFNGGAEAICALAFSPDQSYFVSGSEDGTVTIWSGKTYGGVIGSNKYKAGACALAISPDSSQLVIGGSEGVAIIQPMQPDKDPITLKDQAGICSVAFSPDGSKILTTAQDGATRIWNVTGTKDPLVLQSEQKCSSLNAQQQTCADAPMAAFGPDNKTVATSRCNTVRLWNLDKPAEPTLLGQDTSPAHGLLFRPDGSQIMSATENGVALWKVDNANGQQPRRFLDGAPLRSLQFSQDDRYAVLNTLNGEAWMQDLKGARTTFIPRPDRDAKGGFTLKSAIDQGTIPTNRTRAGIEAVALSPDARYLVAGYDDGSIGVHPGINIPEQRAFRADNQSLLADLKFEHTPTSIMAIWYLEQLHGAMKNFVYEAPKDDKDDGDNPSFLRLGRGEPVTRQRIFSALSDAIERAERTAGLQQSALLVVYVAAHGWIATDGRQYFLPSDADASNPGTWIAFDDFLSPIEAFLAAPSTGGHSDEPDRAAIVIFDTCQTRLGSAQSTPAVHSADEPTNLFVIEATSPGQYAWHWTGNLNSTELTTTNKSTTRLGMTHNNRPKSTDTKSDYASRMSMFPYASQWALNALIKDKRPQAKADDRIISLSEWIATTQEAIKSLQKDLPEVAETGQAQTIRVHNPKMDASMFYVEKNAPPQ